MLRNSEQELDLSGLLSLEHVLLGDDEPGEDVGQHAGEAEEAGKDEDEPEDGGVGIHVLPQTAAHTGQLAVGGATGEFAGGFHRDLELEMRN